MSSSARFVGRWYSCQRIGVRGLSALVLLYYMSNGSDGQRVSLIGCSHGKRGFGGAAARLCDSQCRRVWRDWDCSGRGRRRAGPISSRDAVYAVGCSHQCRNDCCMGWVRTFGLHSNEVSQVPMTCRCSAVCGEALRHCIHQDCVRAHLGGHPGRT